MAQRRREIIPWGIADALFTPGGFIHLTEGMNHECITQKVAGLPRGVVV
jgi:hypothetical protein